MRLKIVCSLAAFATATLSPVDATTLRTLTGRESHTCDPKSCDFGRGVIGSRPNVFVGVAPQPENADFIAPGRRAMGYCSSPLEVSRTSVQTGDGSMVLMAR